MHYTSIERVNELTTTGKLTYPEKDELLGKACHEALGYNPIFCIPVNGDLKDLLFRNLIVAPSYSQRLIIFESDKYDSLEYVSMSEVLTWKEVNLRVNPKTAYSEYVVPEITSTNVLKIVDISDSDDVDEIADEFLEMQFSRGFYCNLFKVCGIDSRMYVKDILELSPTLQLKFMRYAESVILIGNEVEERLIDEFREFVYNELIVERQ